MKTVTDSAGRKHIIDPKSITAIHETTRPGECIVIGPTFQPIEMKGDAEEIAKSFGIIESKKAAPSA